MMIAIVDYGMGNLRSVSKALERVGAKVEVTSDSKKIKKAKAVVLPGVGAFSQAVVNLEKLNLLSVLAEVIELKKPFLGICLGFQLVFTESEEGNCKGLGIIKGRVKRFNLAGFKIPHMGWNTIKLKVKSEKLKVKVLEGIPDSSYFYFVHSYYGEPEDKDVVVATTSYGLEFASVIHKENLFAVQFHPEKSQEIGLQLLKNFVRLVERC